jgi:peroxiredoxin
MKCLAVAGILMTSLVARADGITAAPPRPIESPKLAPAPPVVPIVPLTPAAPPAATDELKIGDLAPAFTLPVYNVEAAGHTMVSLQTYVGPDSAEGTKLLLLSFFATWCAPCKRELPYLEKLQETYGKKGFQVVSISIDREDAAATQIAALVRENHVTFPVLKDRFNLLARRYLGDKSPLPSVFLVSAQGTIVEIHKGYGKDASTFLQQQITQALEPH